MIYEFDIRPVPIQLVIYENGTCKHSDMPALRDSILIAVYGYLREYQIEVGGPPYCRFVAWRDEDCDIEAGFPLLYPVHADGRLQVGQVGGGGALHTLHRGPYNRLGEAHKAALAWMTSHGKRQTGPPWEVYLTGHALFPDPKDWVAEVFYPVR